RFRLLRGVLQLRHAFGMATANSTSRMIATLISPVRPRGDAVMNKPFTPGKPEKKKFVVEEATIDDLHAAIKAGETTVADVVRHYIARVRAFNGTSNLLVTEDGAPVPKAKGTVRGGAPLKFPTETAKASDVLPDLDKYKGPPLEFGRMEATASDPSVQQQFGMTVGKPNAEQVNAIATLNIRGERSVTCRG